MELYKQISDANRIKYGTEAEKILRIIINQYNDRTHFIYEILQNAEDAGATRIQFHLEKEKLVIKHDGRPFNEKDIEGVCGIANGTKEDGTRIGHFGIGFKSVYCYTEHPYIYSGEYHFVIQNQLFPKEVPGSQEIAYDETCMILPFDKGEVPSSIAYQEIRDALTKKITAESIIMLNQISDVRIKIDGYPEKIEINKAKYSLDKKAYADNVFGLSMNTTITNTRSKQTRTKDADYLFFTDANAEATAIIFRVEGKELKAIKNSKIYAFFPTAKEAHQNFYIHAPFDTTPARDNFKEGAEYGKHNIKLIKAVGELIWFAFQWMKNHQYLSISGFNTVFPVYEYEADDVLYGIYQNSIDMIREEALLPTNVPGEFKKIQEICVPLWGIIVDTFDDNDLRALRRKRNISWLAKEFSTEAYHDVRAFLNQNFKLETLEWKDLVLNMDAFFLSQKQLSWMEALMSRIESYCIKRATYDSHYIDVSQIPFVRTVSQEQICARDEHGKLQVYLNNPDIAKYRIESTFIKNESIRSFYRRALEIPEYNIEQETIENILPKYESANVKFKTKDPITENIDDLKVIKDAIYTNTSILERIKDKYIVTDGKNWYRPEEMYLRSNDTRSGYALVKGIVRIKYLADTYFDGTIRSLKLDEDFFKKIGCNAGIRMIPASRDEYLRAIRKYCGAKAESDYRTNIFFKTYISKKLDWSFNYEGFPDIFTDMTKEKSLSIILDNSKTFIWMQSYMTYHNNDATIVQEWMNFQGNIIMPVFQYKIPVILLDKNTPKEAVCQVFENVNTGGVSLTVFELITAVFAMDDFELRKDWEQRKNAYFNGDLLSIISATDFLTACTLLSTYQKGGTVSCKKKDVLNLTLDEYQKYADDLTNGFVEAEKILQEERIFSSKDLPYSTQFIPLAVLCTILSKNNQIKTTTIKNKIKQWYWCGVFGEMYGSANETRYVLDVVGVMDWISDDTKVPKTVQDSYFNPTRLLSLQSRLSAAYKGIMALILKNHCQDFISGREMDFSVYKAENIDIHHIFPKDYCEKQKYDKAKWNSVINKTPITYSTNREIGGVAPSVYLTKIENKGQVSSDILDTYLTTHWIDVVSCRNDNFQEHIIKRAKMLLNAIEKATGKSISGRDSEDVVNAFGGKLS